MKKTFSTLTLAFFLSNVFAQDCDSLTIIKSVTQELQYSTAIPFSKATITLVRFKPGNYGIQFFFQTPYRNASKPFIVKMDSITIILAENKTIKIDQACCDSVYYQNDGSFCQNTMHLLEKKQLEEFKKEKIVELHLYSKIETGVLTIRKRSQTKVYEMANSF
jgi:hypothetical protein